MREIKEDLKIRQFNILKMSVLPQMIYRFNAFPVKILLGFSVELDKLIVKFTWKCKGLRTDKTLEEETQGERICLPDTKLIIKLQ